MRRYLRKNQHVDIYVSFALMIEENAPAPKRLNQDRRFGFAACGEKRGAAMCGSQRLVRGGLAGYPAPSAAPVSSNSSVYDCCLAASSASNTFSPRRYVASTFVFLMSSGFASRTF